MKNISLELTDKIKDTIILFSSSIKDSFKVPLDVIDSNLKNLTSTNIKENMDFNIKIDELHKEIRKYKISWEEGAEQINNS